jgi:hypothetical protein
VLVARCFNTRDVVAPVGVGRLIADNLLDQSSRHLMLLTRNGAALPVAFSTRLLNEADTKVDGALECDTQREAGSLQHSVSVCEAMAPSNGQRGRVYATPREKKGACSTRFRVFLPCDLKIYAARRVVGMDRGEGPGAAPLFM